MVLPDCARDHLACRRIALCVVAVSRNTSVNNNAAPDSTTTAVNNRFLEAIFISSTFFGPTLPGIS
jgi:hypothetical protein